MSILPEDTQRTRVMIEDILGYLPEGALYTSRSGRKGEAIPPTLLYRQAIWYLDEADIEYSVGKEKEAYALLGMACGLMQSRGFMLPEQPAEPGLRQKQEPPSANILAFPKQK